MASEKKGFVLYFDSFDVIRGIGASQRGELFAAIFRYADAVRQQDIDPNEFAQSCDTLDMDTKMALRFIACYIRRDTKVWLGRQESCRAAALRNYAQKSEKQESSRAESMKKYI